MKITKKQLIRLIKEQSNTTTLADMLREMETWFSIDKKMIQKAEKSGINTKNNSKLKRLVQDWGNGKYDEDPELLKSALINLIKFNEQKRIYESSRKLTSDEKEIFLYLNDLRELGTTNMFGAGPYIEKQFGISRNEAHRILKLWMKNFNDKGKYDMINENVKVGDFVTLKRPLGTFKKMYKQGEKLKVEDVKDNLLWLTGLGWVDLNDVKINK